MSNDESVASFLRALAERADADPTFAAHVRAAAQQSGLLRALSGESRSTAKRPKSAKAANTEAAASAETPPDPFTIFRAKGESGLRATLDALELATLRNIVRAHRLDPARISARWAARDRVINLIVDQVRARANHGRAFERV